MKKIYSLLLVLFFTFSLFSNTDYNKIIDTLKKARYLNKNVIVLFTASWCGWCQKLKYETLANSKVKNAIKDYLILNLDFDENNALRKKYGVTGVPCTIFLNSHLQEIDRIVGYLPPKGFIKELKRIKSGKNTYLYLQKFSSEDCKIAKTHYKLAGAYEERGKYLKAIEQYELAKKYGYPEEKIEWGLGILYKDRRNFEKAAKHIEKSIKIGGKNIVKLYNLMLCYYYDKDYGNAIRVSNELMKINKNNKEKLDDLALFVKGLSFSKLGMKKDAIRNLKFILEYYPQSRYAPKANHIINELNK